MEIKKQIIIENNNFKISNGSFVFTKTKQEYILQKVKQILQTVVGEDFQDISKGLDLQEVIFNNRITSSDISAEILRNVLAVEGVSRVESILITQNNETLYITVQFVYDEQLLEISVNI